jgi:hypothetical protein
VADYSKQWCDINDSDMPSDFCIDEIFNGLSENSYVNYICEGFGFDAIGNINGELMVSMPTGSHQFKWITYDELINKYRG